MLAAGSPATARQVAAQHRELAAQHQDLQVVGGVAAGEQHQQLIALEPP
jgi:hypothetical protein